MEKSLGVVAILLLIFLVPTVSAYQIDWYYSNSSSVTHTNVPPFMSNLDCDMQIWENVVANRSGAGTMTVSSEWFQPSGTSVGTNERSFVSNTTCQAGLMGISNVEDTLLNGIYESNVQTTFTGTTTQYEYAKVNYTCSGSDLLDFDFNVNSSYIPRAIPNLYSWDRYQITGGAGTLVYSKDLAISVLGGSNYSYCVPTTPVNQIGSDSGLTLADNETQFVAGASAINARGQKAYYLVFNSTNGDVYYDVDYGVNTGFGSGASQNINTDTVLYNLNDPSSQVTLCSTVTCSGTYTLPKNQLWVFMTTYFHTFNANVGVDGSANFSNPINNFSIDVYEPDYLCGEYTECLNGTQSRVCVDQNGIESDLIQATACFSGFFEEEKLGFENFTTQTIVEGKKTSYSITPCFCTLQNITVDIPSDWDVTFRDLNSSGHVQKTNHFIEMSTDIPATEGTRTLKMWYIPPKLDEAFEVNDGADPATCQNATTGQAPNVAKNLNTSVFVDITFPSEFSILYYDVAKMTQPVVQYDTTPELLTLLCAPFNKNCYGNCTASPRGNYRVSLTNLTDGNVILDLYKEANSSELSTQFADLSELNLQPNENYRLRFEVLPEDLFSSNPTGIYLDNVTIANALTTFTVNCDLPARCDGTTRVTPVKVGDTCTEERSSNSPICIEELQQDDADDQVTTGEWIDAIVDREALDEAGLGYTLFFLSPFFIAMMVMVLVGIVSELYVKSGGAIFGIIVLMGTIGLTMAGVFNIGFAIVFVIISGFILIQTVFKGLGRGGGA